MASISGLWLPIVISTRSKSSPFSSSAFSTVLHGCEGGSTCSVISAIGEGLQGDAVIGLPHAQLVGRAGAHVELAVGPPIARDRERHVGDGAVDGVVIVAVGVRI